MKSLNMPFLGQCNGLRCRLTSLQVSAEVDQDDIVLAVSSLCMLTSAERAGIYWEMGAE